MLIKNFIENNIAESFGKIGGIESSHIANYMMTGRAQILTPMLQISAGVITFNEEQLKKWCEEYIESILSKRAKDNDLVSKGEQSEEKEINPIVLKQIKSLKNTMNSHNLSVDDIIKHLNSDNE